MSQFSERPCSWGRASNGKLWVDIPRDKWPDWLDEDNPSVIQVACPEPRAPRSKYCECHKKMAADAGRLRSVGNRYEPARPRHYGARENQQETKYGID